MKHQTAVVVFTLLLLCAWIAPARAQGVQTGILQGSVADATGLALPGVRVTVTSSALQGPRTTISDANGTYIFRWLPPGPYRLAFELQGFDTITRETTLELGRITVVDARLQVAGLAETVTVTAETPSALATPTGGMNFTREEVDRLPTTRQLSAIAELAPGLTGERTAPNPDQIQVAGGFAYDNVFLIDGVDVNDNLFGSPNTLFIEDAIEETQVMTSGVSAEYGRFSGGVVNAITRSGGNSFAGSLRVNLVNDGWTQRTPFEIAQNMARPGNLNDVYEATLGGPIAEDRVWFFAAGRLAETTDPDPFPQTGLPATRVSTNRRGEIKITGTPWVNHTFQGSFLTSPTDQTQPSFTFSLEPATVIERSLPNRRAVVTWRGVLGERTFATAQYSEKRFSFEDSGGTSTAITDSPFITLTQQLGHYNAPYFDAGDPEDRNNRQLAGSVSYFLTTETGSHDIKGGVERFETRLTGGNAQSPTDYVFVTDYVATPDGLPALDAEQRVVPTFVPGESELEHWLATRGARIDIRTTSFYVQDRWVGGPRWTFDLGLRYERVRSDATGDITTVDTDAWMPRLAASYDALGDGRLVLQGTYGHYSGKYSEAQFAENTPVGNPTLLLGVYNGPAGQGRDFAPGFDPANYQIVSGNFPTANVFVEEGLHSPNTREWTASAGWQFGRGYSKATYVWRDTTDIVEDFITRETGSTVVSEGGITREFQNRIFRNTSEAERRYQGLLFQGRYQVLPMVSVNGHWTIQLRNHGNVEGEEPNQPAIASMIGDYPDILDPERHYPIGPTNDFQRHRLRLWTTIGMDLGEIGRPDVSVLYRYDSPLAFSFAALGVPLSAEQDTRLAGYASRPASQTVYFEGRGTGQFEPSHLFDVALNHQLPIWRSVGPWVKLEVINIFNSTPLIGHNITVEPDPDSPLDALGLPTGFIPGPRFGQATSNAHFPLPRTFRLAFGVRF